MTIPKVIVDTNIVSYIMRGDELAEAYAPHLKDRLVSVTFITVAELYYGAEKKGWGDEKRKQLETVLRNFVVIPYDYEIAKCYALIVASRERSGRPISFADAWIAACAVRHAVPLITHNGRDFERIDGLEVVSEGVSG